MTDYIWIGAAPTAVLICILLIGWGCEAKRFYPKFQLKSWRRVGFSDLELDLGKKGTVRGSCTVYHWYPSGQRCGHRTDDALTQIVQRIKWGVEDEKELEEQ